MSAADRSRLRELTFEIERFYYDEAALIEAGDYQGWAKLLADDIRYAMPQTEFVDRRVNRDLDFIGAHSFDEDKRSIMNRIAWLAVRPTPEVPPPKRRMLVTNVRVLREVEDGADACSAFLLWELRSSGRGATFIGARRDTLRQAGDGWQIRRREVTLDSALLPKALTNFF